MAILYAHMHNFLLFLFFNVYLFLKEGDRQTHRTSREGAERKGNTESEAGSRLRAVTSEPTAGLKPQITRSRPELKSDT